MKSEKFHISDQISIKGDGLTNEDLSDSFENCYWIFDGATAISPKKITLGHHSRSQYKITPPHTLSTGDAKSKSMPQWLTQEFNIQLKTCLKDHKPTSFDDICNIFNASISNLCSQNSDLLKDLKKEETPSMTLTFISISEEKIHIYTIGDSPVYLLSNTDEIIKFYDHRVEAFSTRTLNTFLKYKNHPDKEKKIKNTLSENRKKMNTDTGYWVASLDKNWINKGLYKEFQSSEIKSCLLVSDGFNRIFSLYHAADIENALLGHEKLNLLAQKLRQIEDADPSGKKYPRIKKSDDASAMLINKEFQR